MTTKMGFLADTVMAQKYAIFPGETWEGIATRVVDSVFSGVDVPKSLTDAIKQDIIERKFIPGGRYLYAAGRPFHQTQNCVLFRATDSREGWAEVAHKTMMSLMTGAGVGVTYGPVRPRHTIIRKTGGLGTGPIALMGAVNELGRRVRQGGSRRSAIWAGLPWSHKDVYEFIGVKAWDSYTLQRKHENFDHPAELDMTNVSVQFDERFFSSMAIGAPSAADVFDATLRSALMNGEPGFSIDVDDNSPIYYISEDGTLHYTKEGEDLRNACTEITSTTDNDVCNIGSLVLPRIKNQVELAEVTERATIFLLAGTRYSDVPTEAIRAVRDNNRRLGLGCMGLHEWLLQRGKAYAPDAELGEWLGVYRDVSDRTAEAWAHRWGIPVPIKKRAFAPNGSIAILAETTSSIEPILYVAHKRRFARGDSWAYSYTIDPVAERLINETGMHPDDIETALTLATDPQRRVDFQVFVQGYVDHGISSTINLPAWGTEHNNEDTITKFKKVLLPAMRKLRGITMYPNAARGGQPITEVSFSDAMKHRDEIRWEQGDVCDLTKSGSCGS